ncbi:MAG: hypothetical protein HY999_03350 [Nitrospinae bacterium]|nr:hypothetical protein [Nitrospinota bacterium]
MKIFVRSRRGSLMTIILTILLCISSVIARAQESFDKGISVTKKIAILERSLSVIKKEISRDQEISSWVLNTIALTQTRELLKKDIPEKEKIIEDLKQGFPGDLDKAISLIKDSIEKEKRIVDAVPIDTFHQQVAKNTINEGIGTKKEILKILEDKLKELSPPSP